MVNNIKKYYFGECKYTEKICPTTNFVDGYSGIFKHKYNSIIIFWIKIYCNSRIVKNIVFKLNFYKIKFYCKLTVLKI